MDWNLEEALAYYKTQGAPRDQSAVIALLKEIQANSGGSIPAYAVAHAAESYGVKESLFLAIIRRLPGLRMGDTHILELCAGPNCGKAAHLAALAETLCRESGGRIRLKFVPCMRMCAKGPNARWDGTLHHAVTEDQLRRWIEE